jgi:hypothetical protein
VNKITIMLNVGIMAILGFASSASQFKVDNVLMYPRAYDGLADHFPAMTALAVRLRWLCWGVPVAWLVLALLLLLLLTRKAEALRATAMVQLHTSATLLIGIFMLGFFVFAGLMPFVSFVAGLK